jgi:hypothetical protein
MKASDKFKYFKLRKTKINLASSLNTQYPVKS